MADRDGRDADPGRHDGAALRRLHGEMDGRPHRPLPGDLSHAGGGWTDCRTTDTQMFWRPQFGDTLTDPEMRANSPHRQRRPESARRLWSSTGTRTTGVAGRRARRRGRTVYWHRPSRGQVPLLPGTRTHWILTPGNARIWYETASSPSCTSTYRPGWAAPPPPLHHPLYEPSGIDRGCRAIGRDDL